MRLLVTGSEGLVGRWFSDALRAGGHDVVDYDILLGDDIRDLGALDHAMRGCEGVVHLAAISRVMWGETHPRLCHEVNVGGTASLLAAVARQRQAPWLLFASSREVYGDPLFLPVMEGAAIRPVNHYGRSKVEGELLVEAARATGLHCAILRLSNVYGGLNDHPDRAVPSFLWRALAGEELQVSGSDMVLDFVHVEDCVKGLMTAARMLSDGAASLPTVHLASGVPTTLLDLAETAVDTAGSASTVKVADRRSYDVRGFVGDPSRALEVLGWRAGITLDAGLRRFRDDMIARGRPLAAVPVPVAVPLGVAGERRNVLSGALD
ncbi:NAD-dependent epimerase/dehydratase family protein [Defluviimonas salinarum]|uniref:NAD(P)-dependent oxidoreductase n=1 Tax=Defluviimonas salinarum TaxID=2992147 RepID=A0ABT3J210_9RHOB|nr:NAD(P)-dependent oxidoreductase [Defluviimonas salinarum]MCW3781714.1 NAD(P)-dependent oxidoreductase [Defluviimonas salinarum]